MRRVLIIAMLGCVLSPVAIAMHANLRNVVMRQDPCLAWIVDHEDGTWDPQRQGSGDSYGIPMANPGSKMATAGSDWRTNPYTQLRWMRSYVQQRYGGSCQAEAYWKRSARYYNGDWHGGSY